MAFAVSYLRPSPKISSAQSSQSSSPATLTAQKVKAAAAPPVLSLESESQSQGSQDSNDGASMSESIVVKSKGTTPLFILSALRDTNRPAAS